MQPGKASDTKATASPAFNAGLLRAVDIIPVGVEVGHLRRLRTGSEGSDGSGNSQDMAVTKRRIPGISKVSMARIDAGSWTLERNGLGSMSSGEAFSRPQG